MKLWIPQCLIGLTALFGRLAVALMVNSASIGTGSEAVSTGGVGSSASTNNTESPWQRIVLIGASATAGFTAAEPLGGTNTPRFALSRYVDAALTVSHEPVQNFGNAFFFLQPELIAQQQVARALTNRPTLIIGLDFPFWFCYGEGETDEERLARFDYGLKLLDKIQCPLVVGDIPDASSAVNKMLRPDQMPSLKAIAAANQRLKAWAADRRQVAVVELSGFMRKVLANRAIAIRDYTLPNGQTRMLLQNDTLHPSPPGCAVLALAVLDAYQTIRPKGHATDFIGDAKEIFRQATKVSSPATNSTPAALR